MSDTNDSQKIIDCPHCGKAISATSEKCPYCQKAIELQPEQPKENDTGLKKYNIKKILLVQKHIKNLKNLRHIKSQNRR